MSDRQEREGSSGSGPRNGGGRRNNDNRGYQQRGDGERRPYRSDRDGGERRQYRGDRDGAPRRDGERRPYRGDRDRNGDSRRDGGERRPYRGDRDGERRPYRGDGERRPSRGDDRDGRPRRDNGERRPYKRDRDGERRPYRGDRDRDDRNRDGAKSSGFGRGGTRGGGRSDRGGQGRTFTEAERLQHELRPVRSEHDDPIIPDEITAKDLHPAARNELKTLQAEVQERVSRHLAMVAMLIDDDPALAHQHALSASRRAGRIPVARETLAITAYRTGDFALALRELRTYRRLSGLDGHLALMVDCERGLGRPEKAIETGLAADTSKLETADRVHLAIAMSGARLDLGQTQQALFELEIPELNPKRAFSWSPDLFAAYGAVLEDLGRDTEAATWYAHANRAAAALQDHLGSLDELEVLEIRETEVPVEDAPEAEAETDESEAPAASVDAEEAPAAEATFEPAQPSDEPAAAPQSFADEIEAEVAELLAEGIEGAGPVDDAR